MGNSCSATHVSSKTFAVESTDNDGALAEVIAAEEDADALEDTDPLPSTDGTDDSDFRDVPLEKEVDDAYEAEEGSSGENDVDGRSEEEEDEGSDEDEETGHSKFGAAPKIHQTVLRQKSMWSCTLRVFEEDLRFLEGFSRHIRNVLAGAIPAVFEPIVYVSENPKRPDDEEC
ncbi:hypothetical protein GN244_ATG16226 [Phytophthora infestans]|uniref:Uncharacterized protein n=1 Tax=Phytophthora infestans TaxID=4787 RepID=A0A833SIK6_PHYIN|nr:hypothetical protein GN244_ATG16226 [Phytophthora infestans]